MTLQVTKWLARLTGKRGGLVLPFDARFNGGNWNNRLPLSRIGGTANWEVFVDFASQMDPNDPSYPRYARLEDSGDFALLTFNCTWSMRAGVQYGVPGSQGPVPNAVGRRDVRITLLNGAQQPLLSQSGSYFIDPG
ncbi:MAG: hypothetical protein LJE95_03615 [Acidobacteria bacterium]|nr:hypothetical protein [Acidobacteriota bacterium]